MIHGLPEKLKRLRQNCMLSQRDVARRLDVSPSIISAYETGERTPSVENILALALMYGCTTDYLLGCETVQKSVRGCIHTFKELLRLFIHEKLRISTISQKSGTRRFHSRHAIHSFLRKSRFAQLSAEYVL